MSSLDQFLDVSYVLQVYYSYRSMILFSLIFITFDPILSLPISIVIFSLPSLFLLWPPLLLLLLILLLLINYYYYFYFALPLLEAASSSANILISSGVGSLSLSNLALISPLGTDIHNELPSYLLMYDFGM